MAHPINLAIQTLSNSSLVGKIESLLTYIHNYFSHSPKHHFETSKLVELLNTKAINGNFYFYLFLTSKHVRINTKLD
jgi:hypothetical protein